jgi:mevalonate kinase
LPFNSRFNAKLLLTAEYLVLNGAKALAVPLRFGQALSVVKKDQGCISWQSVASDGSTWFRGEYNINDFSMINTTNPEMAVYPKRLMQAARELNPGFVSPSSGCHVISTLNYPLLWGLGSSSTLIAAVAAWAGIDPFKLHFKVSKGSGYDIACAISKKPVLYNLQNGTPNYSTVNFSPRFAENIFFVYQGKKQDSSEGISKFRSRNTETNDKDIIAVNLLTDRLLYAETLSEFEDVMKEHEGLISTLLGVPPIKKTLFNDLPGEVKSLGAWGGDFCMLTWHDDPLLLSAYLKSKKLETWFNFSDIVL